MQEEHHKRAEVATNRPAYREARWERAVKVSLFTFNTKWLEVRRSDDEKLWAG